tara:strand:+ start:170 stop:514 length:345 start_codon:yes stop_codon:yes gene_type:complete
MKIEKEDYEVEYDISNGLVRCSGSLRLHGSDEYQPILDLLVKAADEGHEKIVLDLSGLQFLNSSGINMFSKFILHLRKHDEPQIVVRGSATYPWQSKSLKNFQRLLPRLTLVMD